MATGLEAQGQETGFVVHEKLLVLVSLNSDHDFLIRKGGQIANQRKIPWLVVWVDTGQIPTHKGSRRLQSVVSLAKEMGAHTEVLRGPSTFQTIITYIEEQRITTVLVGAGTRSSFKPWGNRLYRQLIESGLPLEVSVIRSTQAPKASAPFTEIKRPLLGNIQGYGSGVLAVTLATILAAGLQNWIHHANLVLVYVLAVIATGLRYGSRPAMMTAVLSFLCFNFFLTDPHYTFEVARHDELSTLIFLFLIAIICGPAASRIRGQFLLLREVNRYSEAMRSLGEALSIAEDAEALWLSTAKKLSSFLQVEVCITVPDEGGCYITYPAPSSALSSLDIDAIEWTHKYTAPSGRLTDMFNASSWTVFPICKETQCIACTLIRLNPNDTTLVPYDRDLIQGMLQQAADTWRRIQLVGDLESARVKTEVEQLRSALLSSVSHDLKSPLAAMMGAAESLQLLEQQLDPQDRKELLETIVQESRRLDSYIQNLLDMTRLGYGTLKIERDWVSIADIVGSALTRLKRYYPNVKTATRFPDAAPVLYVHAALIEQALFNILENAARFTPINEKIDVTITASDKRCTIAIEDRGPGIPEDLREKIFDMFFVVAEGDKKKQNTGMGLAICRGMIGAHGGSVQAMAGAKHKGTRFVVELPLDVPPATSTTSEE